MHPDTPSRLLAARASLVLGPVIAGVSVILQPDLDGSASDRLAALANWPATVSAVAFLASQLPLLIAILAIGRLLLPRAARLSACGTALGVLGCFGHTVFGGTSLIYLMMARDQDNRAAQRALFDHIQNSPVMLASIAGLAGTILGLLLLGIGLYRTRTGPIWVGPAIWAFLVVEFAGTAISSYASYLSVLLLGAAFVATARLLHTTHQDQPALEPMPANPW